MYLGNDMLGYGRRRRTENAKRRGGPAANATETHGAAATLVAGQADAVAFGKLFIANPDLPRRIALKAPLGNWDSATFYSQGAEGYTSYPRLAEAAE